MQLDEAPGERKPEAGAFTLAQIVAARLPEFLEDERLLVGGDADAGVDDGDLDGVLELPRPQRDAPARGRELDGVGQQVDHCLLKFARVGHPLTEAVADLQRQRQPVTLVRERAQRHGLTLELEVGDGLAEWVADARKVKQVVVNLLSNAVKFTPNGGRVSVRARHLNGVDGRAGEWAEVSVSDTGVGIAKKDQALVFEEFRQASGDVLHKSEGTGLGLALVKRFVELHGGQITLASAPGRGSTFTITLPQHELKVLQ